MRILRESDELRHLNEMYVNVLPALDPKVTNSIYYNRLKYLMFNEIVQFCREKLDLKQDLLAIRPYIGDYMSEEDIRKTFDGLKNKYNGGAEDNVGIDYHIETTRVDYGVCVFAIIKRDDIYAKKFVFRFRKTPSAGLDLSNLTAIGSPLPEKDKAEIRKTMTNEFGGAK